MLVNGKHYRTIWCSKEDGNIYIIDQRKLPFKFEIEPVDSLERMCVAIKDMHLRGAGLIGAAAAYGMYLAVRESASDTNIARAAKQLTATRPTAVNLSYAVQFMQRELQALPEPERLKRAWEMAEQLADTDAAQCRRIGQHGVKIIEEIAKAKADERVNILTHCNAGWLAFVDYGSALSPVYEAHKRGIDVHVYVDETRPRNQGARLTAWELAMQGVPHTLIADNTGGHLMQHGMVDMVITGADRVTARGDVANKIGTYLKALAAKDNAVPFYVAFPSTTFDKSIKDGMHEIEIEERSGREVTHIEGMWKGQVVEVQLGPETSPALNFGFDVTPARLVTAWITDEGIMDLKNSR
jgi:methylthioribose-1-phosphate isomerase